mgnify:CR=1 FL=1
MLIVLSGVTCSTAAALMALTENSNGGKGMIKLTNSQLNYGKKTNLLHSVLKNYDLYILVLPAIVYVFIFNYVPMYGITIAFKDFMPRQGILGSPWIGFRQFNRFFSSYYFKELITNTFLLSFLSLLAGFPAPIIFALMLNQIYHEKYKRFTQTVSYAPHFISTMVLVGMINIFISPRSGFINILIRMFGGETIHFQTSPYWFRPIYIISGIWQNTGWNAIVYLAALTSIDQEMLEASTVDGANKFQKIIYIEIPSILPTIVILLILGLGNIMSVGFQKAFLLQTPMNLQTSEIIATYVYKVGLLENQFSFSTAVSLFDNVINLIFLILVNSIAKRVQEVSLW